jgi:hypothetical protein
MVIGFRNQFVNPILLGTKIHTVRVDSHNRWYAGRKMHLATGIRTKNYKQFATGVCEMVFPVTIDPYIKRIAITFNGEEKILDVNEFAHNDGFSSTEEFWNWFNKPCKMKLIYFKIDADEK